MTKSRKTRQRRRERKIVKLYRIHDRSPKQKRRLLSLGQAEANEMRRIFRASYAVERATFEADLRKADELIKKYESDDLKKGASDERRP